MDKTKVFQMVVILLVSDKDKLVLFYIISGIIQAGMLFFALCAVIIFAKDR